MCEVCGDGRRTQKRTERERERHSVCVRVCVLPLRPCRLLCEVAAVLLVLPDTCFAYRRGRAERRGGWDDNGKMRVPQDVRERERERERLSTDLCKKKQQSRVSQFERGETWRNNRKSDEIQRLDHTTTPHLLRAGPLTATHFVVNNSL